jgi:hypothetical protein
LSAEGKTVMATVDNGRTDAQIAESSCKMAGNPWWWIRIHIVQFGVCAAPRGIHRL